jgi:hypothetical protein
MKILWLLVAIAILVLMFSRLRANKAPRPAPRNRRDAFLNSEEGRAASERMAAITKANNEQAQAARTMVSTQNAGSFKVDQHVDGVPDSQPFGEDIDNPDAREIPAKFHGPWKWEKAADFLPDDPRARSELIAADKINFGNGDEPVVAVRFIGDDGIAVVTQAMDNGKWDYSLRYFGISADGQILKDLESADMKWVRADA